MSNFYYIVHATHGDNVGSIEATNEKDALAKLKSIYAPDHPETGEPHKLIEFKLLDKKTHDSEKVRIDKQRKEEAEA